MQRLNFLFLSVRLCIQVRRIFGECSVNFSQKNVVLIGANYYAPYRGFLNASLGVNRETFRLADTLRGRRSANTDVIDNAKAATIYRTRIVDELWL